MPSDQDFSGFKNDKQRKDQTGRTGGLAPGASGQGAVAGVASGSFGAQAANPYAGLTQEPLNPTGSALANSSTGPTATGHVNFDQIYNANAGTSARKASQLQGVAGAKGNAARTGMTAAQAQFGQGVRAGTLQGPSQAQIDWAKYGATGVQMPKEISKAQTTTDGRTAITEKGQGLTDGSEIPVQAQGVANDPNAGQYSDQLTAGSTGQYSGPNSLSEMGVYQQLLKDAGEAQDLSSSLASGNEGVQAQGLNQLDAALVGGAGRRGFAELGKQYGSVKNDLDKANKDSIGIADAAKKKSTDAAAAYKALLDERRGRIATDQATADAITAKNKKVEGSALTPEPGDKWKGDDESVKDWFYKGATLQDARNQTHGRDQTFGGRSLSDQWASLTGDLYTKDESKLLLNKINDADWREYQSIVSYGPKTVGKWVKKMMEKYKIANPQEDGS